MSTSQFRWKFLKTIIKDGSIYPNYQKSYIPLDILVFTTGFLSNVFLSDLKKTKTYCLNIINARYRMVIRFCENGNIIQVISKLNNEYHGDYKEWWSNGQILFHNKYVFGIRQGECLSWYQNGQLETKGYYINDRLHGRYFLWYRNGRLKADDNYIFGDKHGVCKEWYGNGQIKSKIYYHHGVFHGVCKEWFKVNGQVRSKCYYIFGKRHGKSFSWYQNGHIRSVYNWYYNIQDGKMVKYYNNQDSEQIECKKIYLKGLLHGRSLSWYRNGKFRSSCFYIMGKKLRSL